MESKMAKGKNSKEKTEKKSSDFGLESNTLAWCRAVDATPGLLFGIDKNNKDLKFDDHFGLVLETIRRRMPKSYDNQNKAQKNEEKSGNDDSRNLAEGEEARLSNKANALRMETHILIRPIETKPYSCDHPQTAERLAEVSKVLVQENDLVEALAKRLVYQIVSGNIFWRNKGYMQEIHVRVECQEEQKTTVVECSHGAQMPEVPVVSFAHKKLFGESSKHPVDVFMEATDKSILDFVRAVKETLCGNKKLLVLKVVLTGDMVPGARIYPSQSAIPGKKKFQRYLEQPIISADKILNALRRFDWNHGLDNENNPLDTWITSVEPSGGTVDGPRVRGENGRKPDFYKYKEAFLVDKTVLPTDFEERLYILTCFMRGGVFVKEKPKGTKEGETSQTVDNNNIEQEEPKVDITGGND
jgi:hypothetical protein